MGYTPFINKAAGAINQGLDKRYEQDITKRAFMGDKQALSKLSSINPQAYQKIISDEKAKKQAGIQAANRAQDVAFREKKLTSEIGARTAKQTTSSEKQQRKVLADNQEYAAGVMEDSSKLGSFEEAKAFVAKKVSQNKALSEFAKEFELTEEMYEQNKKVYGRNLAESDPVQSSKIMASGLVQFIRKSGKVETVNPSKANKILIKEAEDRDAELQGLRSSERSSGTNAQKVSIDAFKTAGQIRKSINNIDRGIGYIDEGAEAGIIDKYIPSITEASVKLDNLVGQMGLDVIASVTFGALSESELKFALSVAAPPNLQPEALKKWFIEKKAAQEKLLANLEEVAIFMGTPGNSIADFVKMKKEEKEKSRAGEEKATPNQGKAEPNATQSSLPNGVSEDDITATMQANNMTREQVLKRLGAPSGR